MKITPLEIRQKAFEKALRGYDRDEVNAFLVSLSQEWERVLEETKTMKIKLEAAEKEVSKLREVENSLYQTLKTAETTGANLMEQAQKSADLLLKESQLNADSVINEARQKAKDTIEEAEEISRQLLGELEEQLNAVGQQYKALKLHRDNLLSDIKRVASDTMERVERSKAVDDFDPDQHIGQARREYRKELLPDEMKNTLRVLPDEQPQMLPEEQPQLHTEEPEQTIPEEPTEQVKETELVAAGSAETAPRSSGGRSFFDEIG